MKRPSILKSQRRRSLSHIDINQHKNLTTIKKMKAYIPCTRVQKLKVQRIPQSLPNKLIIVSNYEGNGFRNHGYDIEMFETTPEIKQQIKSSLIKLNKAAYKAWEDKKTPLQVKKFKIEKILMYILIVLIFVLIVVLIQESVQSSSYSRTYAYLLLGIISSISVIAVIIGISSVFKKYQQNSLETDIKNVIKKQLNEFNNNFFLSHNLIWRANVDFLWVSLSHNDIVSNSSSYNIHCRKPTQQSFKY